jgi:cobalt-zinc-cadmium efflux system protein
MRRVRSLNEPHLHDHHHHHAPDGRPRALVAGFVLTVTLAVVEAAGGWWASSLALLSDAGHMVSDATALGLAAFAARIAAQPPSARHSYGLLRAEVVAALFNGVLMLAVVAGISLQAIDRLRAPQPVDGGTVIAIAAAGLAINLVVLRLLHGGRSDLNVRAAAVHVMGDLLGSVAALASGLVVYTTGWTAADPLLSFLICALILLSSLRLLRDVLHVLMEGVPRHLDLPQVGQAMAAVPGVREVHDLHIWTVSSGMVALSAHVVIQDMARWEGVLERLRRLLNERYAIEHVTLQPEPAARAVRVEWSVGKEE